MGTNRQRACGRRKRDCRAMTSQCLEMPQGSFNCSTRSKLRHCSSGRKRSRPAMLNGSARLGYLYALGILGVDMINQNGLPTSHNPVEANGDFARRALTELEKSTDAAMVGVAGRILGQYGLMMSAIFRGASAFTVDYVPLAEAFLIRAQELEPTNRQWSSELEQFRKLRSDARQGK